MKSATLVIYDGKRFAKDIWQADGDFTKEQWKQTIRGFADVLEDVYDYLDQDRGDDTYPDDKLYIVGDIMNMLLSIDVKKEG